MIRPPEGQDLPEFLHFDPVPVKARRDGWTPLRQFRFILAIARGLSTSEAVRACGMTRASLYKALAEDGNPAFDTLARVLDTLGFRLCVVANAPAPPAVRASDGAAGRMRVMQTPGTYDARAVKAPAKAKKARKPAAKKR